MLSIVKKNSSFFFFLILFISALLRLWNLDTIPIAFTHDETALGYTAYSFLKTAADEKGNILPLAIEPFGNWTLPLYSYITMIPIALVGLNEFAVRLPSAIAGVIATALIYCVAKQLFKKESTALFAGLFFAISPWSIHFSRLAFEVNLATTFFLAGLYFFLKGIEDIKKGKMLLLSAIFFSLTLFTYFTYVIFTPLFVISLYFVYRKNMRKNKFFIHALVFFFIFLAISLFSTVTQSLKQLTNVGIFDERTIIYNRVELLRGDTSHGSETANKLLHNKFPGVSYQLLQNYLSSFSTEFLFDKGGPNSVNNIGFIGNLYIYDAILLIVGFAGLFWNKDKNIILLSLWLLIGPLASSFTKDAPSSTRLFVLLPLLVLISSYAASLFFSRDRIPLLGKVFFIFFMVINVLYFFDIYYIHFNHQRAKYMHYGYKQIVELSHKYPTHKVVVVGPQNFPYISFLFYNKYDPTIFRKEVEYYPRNKENRFLLVKKFNRYMFVDAINRKQLLPHTLYIDDYKSGDRNSIILPSGEPLFTYIITP